MLKTTEQIFLSLGKNENLKSENPDLVLSMLPQLPNGWVRLTHFTDTLTAEKILKGNFKYLPGSLGNTTDAYSQTSQIKEVITTGNVGVFNRSHFGDTVVLFDLEASEHKKRTQPGSTAESVPNSNIIGYIKIKKLGEVRSYELVLNERYKPTTSDIEIVKALVFDIRKDPDDSSIDNILSATQNPDFGSNEDIW